MTCLRCDATELRARGLCVACYSWARRRRLLDVVGAPPKPPPGRRVECLDVLEEFLWLIDCACGCHRTGGSVHGLGFGCPCGSERLIAPRLGLSVPALKRALQRARARRAEAPAA